MKNRSFYIVASIFGALSGAFGAFGAHTLKELITHDQLVIYEKGISYQFYHTIALFITAFLIERNDVKYFKWAGYCFIGGIIFFSGSLYLLSMNGMIGLNEKIIGPITPIGGLGFIMGWLFLAYGNFKLKIK
jgi:uncharacterized membrane protein YgdD (TMEM256/DUF423 family)